MHTINSVINVTFSTEPITDESVFVPPDDTIMAEIIQRAKEADTEQGLNLLQTARAVRILTPPPPPSELWMKLFMDLPWQGILSCVLIGVWGLAISVCVGYFGYRLYVINLALVAMAPQGLIPSTTATNPTPGEKEYTEMSQEFKLIAVAVLTSCVTFLIYMLIRTLVAIKSYRNIKTRSCLDCRSRLVIVITSRIHVAKFHVSKLRFAKGYMLNTNVPSVTVKNITSCCGLITWVTLEWADKLKFRYLTRDYEIPLPTEFRLYGHKASQVAKLGRTGDSTVSAVIDKICSCNVNTNSKQNAGEVPGV
jgi:uncharacterized protein YebE (UPF0316 family)